MSIRKRVARTTDGEVVLTVKVSGDADVFTFATSMLDMRQEFATAGRKALRSLRESVGRERYAELDDLFNGRTRAPHGRGPRVVWYVLRGGQVLHAAQRDGFTATSRIIALCGRSGLVRIRVEGDTDIRRCPSCVPRAEKLESIP